MIVLGVTEQVESNVNLKSHQSNNNYTTGGSPVVMTTIYEEIIHLVIFQRSLPDEVTNYCQRLPKL